MFSLPSQDLIKDRILPWLLTLQQSPFSQFYYMLSRKCLTAILYFHSIITLPSLSPSGLASTAAEGMHPEENIYIIEENVYEVEDPYECYCSINSGQQS